MKKNCLIWTEIDIQKHSKIILTKFLRISYTKRAKILCKSEFVGKKSCDGIAIYWSYRTCTKVKDPLGKQECETRVYCNL